MSNISWHFFNVKLACVLAASLACGMASANNSDAASSSSSAAIQDEQASQLWVTTGFRSYHFKRSPNYNENNTGIGFEWHFDEERAIMLGTYRNSVRESTHYLHYVWTPLKIGPIRVGGAAGLIDGYPDLNDGKVSFSLIPAATWHFKLLSHDVGLNLVYIPTIARQVDGSLALQFKIRLK